MEKKDIRWEQRFVNYKRALDQLNRAIDLSHIRDLTELEQQGLIQTFEFTHELAWKVIKDYLFYQGNNRIMGSRDATREAFQNQMITDGEGWMDMINTRNKAVRTYDETTVEDVIWRTSEVYYSLFVDFEAVMLGLMHD